MNTKQEQLDKLTAAGITVDEQSSPWHWQLRWTDATTKVETVMDYWWAQGTLSVFGIVWRCTRNGEPAIDPLIELIQKGRIQLDPERIKTTSNCQYCGDVVYGVRSINKIKPEKHDKWTWIQPDGQSHWFHCAKKPTQESAA